MPTKRSGLLDQYFYFWMSLLIATVVVFGFSQQIGPRFLHPSHPKPFILSVHVALFSAWVILYVAQSALVRAGRVAVHRRLGWFGVALGVTIPVVGTITAITMRRFDLVDPELALRAPLLRTAVLDLACFTIPFALAIYWRGRPELHRRFMLIATCGLTAAAFVRFPAMFHPWPWYYAGVDLLILLGVMRDLVVNRRVHPIYLWALPTLVMAQVTVMNTILHFWP